jgi:CheY-like chemotaxis protein/signal transduction histidine kinase
MAYQYCFTEVFRTLRRYQFWVFVVQPRQGIQALKNKEILVVEDDRMNRRLMSSLVEGMGFTAHAVENAEACLEFCKEQVPDLILMDIVMPEMDGIEACRLLRKTHSKSELPIIMVTSRSEGSDLMEAFSVGASDYVTKPIDRMVFFARLEQQLRLAETEQQLKSQSIELEESLRIQRSVGDVLPDGIFVIREDSRTVHFANHVMRKRWHITERCAEDEVFKKIAQGELIQQLHAMCRDCGHTGRAESEFEVSEDRGGLRRRKRNYFVLTTPVEYGEGLRLWLIRDVTNLRRMEEKLQQQVKLDTMRTLSGGIAHNFNNYIGAIVGGIEILKRRMQDDERGLRCLESMDKAAKFATILNTKLATAILRNEAKRETIDAQTLKVICNTVLEELGVTDQQVRLVTRFDPDLTFVAPRSAMQTLISNLVSNAIDAKAKRVWIQSGESEHAGLALLKFEDDGSGMTEEVAKKAFDPFFSTKNLDVRNNVSIEGNGLGLWVVHSLVKGLEGSIVLKSVPGRGTVQLLQLPTGSNTLNRTEK